MAEQDVERRSELASYLGRVWPCTAAQLVQVATGHSAPDRVLEVLRALPSEQTYANLQELWRTVSGGHVESSRFSPVRPCE